MSTTGGPGRLVLASASPRRLQLLSELGLSVEVRPADVDETPRPAEDPVAYVRRLAIDKVQAVADVLADPLAAVIGADTTVVIDGCILGKPVDADEARRMLRSLSGRTHQVHTGVAVWHRGAIVDDVATTDVTFHALSDEAIEHYVCSGEPMDKAGAYAIQGEAGRFVAALVGSRTNVIGLPMERLGGLLGKAGVGRQAR